MINLTLKLFNSVVSKPTVGGSFDVDNGLYITPSAQWAMPQISQYYKGERLNGNDLNKTFHKSWGVVMQSSHSKLILQQVLHYLSTYGTDMKGEIYIPDEVLNLEGTKLSIKVITSYTEDEFIEKCLNILTSGVALTEETIADVLDLLALLGYKFTSLEGIRNKEVCVLISDRYSIYPSDPVEVLRYCIYKSTSDTLLIKNDEVITLIKESKFDPSSVFRQAGLDNMATIFNRFKPLFLAYKGECKSCINKISKLSKKHHKPLIVNPLNVVTSVYINERDLHWVENATVFSLFKAINACHSVIKGQQDFVYRIRNGKSWTTKKGTITEVRKDISHKNMKILFDHLSKKHNLSGKKFYIPKSVEYALPTSEKMFVGNIPTGSKFIGEKLAVGVYWENKWGASDLDVSGINLKGKIGWNADYNQEDQLFYSGDITNAPDGAVEYLHCQGSNIPPTMVMNNVYSGDADCGYKIVVGCGDDVTKDYMMKPDNVMLEVKCNSIQNSTYLGLLTEHINENNCFILLNFGSGHARIGGESELSAIACNAIVSQYTDNITLNILIESFGGELVDKPEDGVYNLSPEVLEKDTLMNIFS